MWWLFVKTVDGWQVVTDKSVPKEWAARSEAVKFAERYFKDSEVRIGLVYGEPLK